MKGSFISILIKHIGCTKKGFFLQILGLNANAKGIKSLLGFKSS